jgi:hypothetical protein
MITHPARTSQTFYRKNIYKISPPPGQINGELVEINAYPIGAMAVAAQGEQVGVTGGRGNQRGTKKAWLRGKGMLYLIK